VKKAVLVFLLFCTATGTNSQQKKEIKVISPKDGGFLQSTFSPKIETQPKATTVIQFNVPSMPNTQANAHPDIQANPNLNSNPNMSTNASQNASLRANISIKNEILFQITTMLKNSSVSKIKNAIKKGLGAAAKDIGQRTGTIFHDTRHIIWNHKWKLGLSTLAALYGFLLLEIWRSKKQNGKWGSWKKDIPFADLLAVPQKNLAQQLIDDIKTIYLNAENATNQLAPLIEFLKAIDKELKQEQRSLKINSFIETTRIEKAFPIKPNTQSIKEKIQRLTYLKNLFTTWLSDYKLQQKKQMLDPVVECNNPYELCQLLAQQGYKLNKKIYNPKNGRQVKNPYTMALILLQQHPDLIKKKNFIATAMLLAKGSKLAAKGGIFLTKNAYELMKFLLVAGFKIQNSVRTVANSSYYQSTKDFLVNLF